MTIEGKPEPRATYRLQLGKSLGFRDVRELVPYLAELGISHAYLSPILKSRPGSTHGYDTVDHAQLNPELGTMAEFRSMAAALRGAGIGILLDIVPNHMGIGGASNPYWLDVLEAGRRSRYADWFDIDWEPPERRLRGKVLVPFLGVSTYDAIHTGAIALRLDAARGGLAAWVYDEHKLPLRASSYPQALPRDPDFLDLGRRFAAVQDDSADLGLAKAALSRLLEDSNAATRGLEREIEQINADPIRLGAIIDNQHWRVAHFSAADDQINYRRFFNVADLAGIRVERREVFEHVHRLVFELIGDGLVDGLRIDHIDGLADPKAYCLELRRCSPRPIYIVVEKILAAHEHLPGGWNVDGTTGYEFAAQLTPLLVDPAAEAALTELHQNFAGGITAPAEIERQAKREIMDSELAAELESLAIALAEFAQSTPATADLLKPALRRALRAILTEFPVYRTYADASAVAAGRRAVEAAEQRARRHNVGLDPAALGFVATLLKGGLLASGTPVDRRAALRLIQRVQQFSGPVMAKGLEDTALYRYSRLVALNEVGQRPEPFSTSTARFHDANRARRRTAPDSMLATTTHDTKRGEDTRARIAAISGDPDEWRRLVGELRHATPAASPRIDPEDEYLLFQLLVGAWPVALTTADSDGLSAFRERIRRVMRKSVREARRRTDWRFPNGGYEAAVLGRVDALFGSEAVHALERANETFGRWGAHLGLVQAALKLTVPGVPDIYAGAESWEQSMVDPDNRRPVDFVTLRVRLGEALASKDWTPWLRDWRDARAKLSLTARLLKLRQQSPALFARGSYEPLDGGSDVLAFMRRLGTETLLVGAWLRPWNRTPPAAVPMPAREQAGEWLDVLRNECVRASGGTITVGPGAPVTVLIQR